VDEHALGDIEWLKGVIVGVRNIRGEMNIPPVKALSLLLKNGDETDKSRLEQNAPFLVKLAKLADITWLSEGDEAPVAATALVGNLEILVPMAGLIDQEAELSRLAKEIDKLNQDLARIKGKLSNASFVDRAPAEVVAKEREKLDAQKQALAKLQEQEQRIQQL
jgi:valyl-tRNA synthetase